MVKACLVGSLRSLLPAVLPPRWRELEPEEGAWRGSEAGSGGPAEGAEQQAGEQGQQAHEDEAAAAAGNTKASEDQAAQEEEEEEGTAAQYDEGQYQAAADKEEEEEEGEGPAEAAVASLLFYGVRGQQMREGDAPSYFNPLEVWLCSFNAHSFPQPCQPPHCLTGCHRLTARHVAMLLLKAASPASKLMRFPLPQLTRTACRPHFFLPHAPPHHRPPPLCSWSAGCWAAARGCCLTTSA